MLKAFSAGCSALTGVEAIANGVPLFKEPRVRRAKRTELLLGAILGVHAARAWPCWPTAGTSGPGPGQTVLSQIMAMAVGRNWAYYAMSLTITLVLALAANTSFGGLPVLASLLARDNYLPHLFALRDDRQVFAPGIWTLAILAGVLLIAVRGNTLTLIPLFAIGVFTGFTLSQTGLVVHWRRTRPPRWRVPGHHQRHSARRSPRVATVVFLLTKFTEGAWVVVIAVPAFIVLFTRIHRYYRRAGRGPRPRRASPAKPRSRADHRGRPGDRGVPAGPARHLRGAVHQRAGDRRDRGARGRRRPSTGRGQRAAGAVGPLESRRAAAGAAHRVRVGGRADRRVHRPALPSITTSRSSC